MQCGNYTPSVHVQYGNFSVEFKGTLVISLHVVMCSVVITPSVYTLSVVTTLLNVQALW